MRVDAPNKDTAESYDTGHSLLLKMTHRIPVPDDPTNYTLGQHDEYELKLFVPQTYGVEIGEQMGIEENSAGVKEILVGIEPGNDETVSFLFNNTGNGDDTYSITIGEVPAEYLLWSVTGASAIEVGPRSTQGYSVNIHAPSIADGAEFSVVVTITSENNGSSESVTLNIQTATPVLSWVEGAGGEIANIDGQDGFAPTGQTSVLWAQIQNTGLVDARDVEVILLHPGEDIDDPSDDTIAGSQTLDILRGQTVQFNITVAGEDLPGTITYTWEINSTSNDAEIPDDVVKQKVNYQKQVGTKANNWVGLFVAVFLGGIIGLFWKFSGRRGGQAF